MPASCPTAPLNVTTAACGASKMQMYVITAEGPTENVELVLKC